MGSLLEIMFAGVLAAVVVLCFWVLFATADDLLRHARKARRTR